MQRATLVEVVASAQIHGGTRVIVMTVREPQPHHFVAETTAYDSNRPGENLGYGRHTGLHLATLLAEVREQESRAFEHSEHNDGCDCWAKWDPNCGRSGCWGVYEPTAAR